MRNHQAGRDEAEREPCVPPGAGRNCGEIVSTKLKSAGRMALAERVLPVLKRLTSPRCRRPKKRRNEMSERMHYWPPAAPKVATKSQ